MKLIRLLASYTWDFVRANAVIARQVLSPRLEVRPETVVIPTEAREPYEVLALSNLITFTPGTLVLDFEPGKYITVHVLNDAAGAEATIKERLEQPLLAVLRKP
ncbi:MAG: Na+/H+ antiporter subunit E [Verrucomicrobiales bacterium]|nr:Na+/H+ antiporter subunit E [Verrucomicrobiales bacterium]